MTPLKRLLTGSAATVPLYDPVSFTIFVAGKAFAFTIPAIIFYAGTTLITSWALKALMPKVDMSGTRGLLTNTLDGVAPQQYVYGKVRKGGVVTFYEASGTDNKFLHMVLCLAGHEVETIESIYIDDKIVTLDGSGFVTSNPWNSKIRIKKHLGSETQTADADLMAETSADSTFRGRGIAYIYARLEYDQDVFTNGIPTITAVVKGKKVYDPRTGLTAWSDNAALCIRDYLTDVRGLGDTAIDDTMLAVSANISDELVMLARLGTEKRYTMNGVVSADSTPNDVLQNMMTSCAGTLFWGQGAWKLKVAHYTPPVRTFTLDDILGPITLQTRTSMADIFNAVQGTFNDQAQDWITADFPKISSGAFVAEDDGVESVLDLELPMTTSAATAQRISKLTLYRGREQMTFSADFGLAALDVQVGDIVAISNERYGWIAKEFEVTSWKFYKASEGGDMRIAMSLREISEAAFDWNADEQELIANNSNLPNAWFVPGIGIAVSSQTRVIYEKLTNVISINVTTAGGVYIEKVEVQYRLSGAADWEVVGTGSPGRYDIIDVGDSFYDIRVRGYNQFGVRGEWTYYNGYQVAGLAEPPETVTGFHGQVYAGTIVLEWKPVADLDLSHYRIRYAVEESGATFANATTAVDKVPRPGSSIIVPARPGTYMIRAVDKTGNASSAYSSVIIPEAAFEPFAHVLTLTDSPTFAGTKTNCGVTGGQLCITSGGLATYVMSAPIDTGAARRVRARLDVNVNRYDPNLGLFDSLTGMFDALPGLFDDFTGGTNESDTDVVMYIATSPDAVNWSDWSAFKGGDFYGRAFKFKVELTSDTADVTPSISGLTARVWYN